jgi:hypothetical protein
MAQERAAMKAYVTASDHLQYTQLADGNVQVRKIGCLPFPILVPPPWRLERWL